MMINNVSLFARLWHDNEWICLQFMKRTKDKVEKEQFQEEGEEYFGSELTSRMKKAS